ncbi:hypothetical protein [Nocardia sp. NPDC059239]|uniref:hypothetical protein n=1 Tax=unclassified Nocardia TaxID=2637762 RepID=UPI0036A519CD
MTALIMVGMIAISPKLFARFGARTMTVTGLLLAAGYQLGSALGLAAAALALATFRSPARRARAVAAGV